MECLPDVHRVERLFAVGLQLGDTGEQDDPELKKFSIDHDRAYILSMLRMREPNPELFLFSCAVESAGMMIQPFMLAGRSARAPWSRIRAIR